MNIPHIYQKPGSFHCQLATSLMVLKYFKDEMNYEDLEIILKEYMLDGGMHSQGPAQFFADRGYDVFFAHHDLQMLIPEIENCTEKDIEKFKKRLLELEDNQDNQYQIEKIKLDIKLMESGVKYSTRLPKLSDIDDYLNKNIPVVLSAVRNKGLHLRPGAGQGNHAIVITGKENDEYFVNDPSPNSEGQYKISSDRLLHAWYNSGAHMRVVWK